MGRQAVSVYSAAQIGLVSQNLGAVEDWLREKCEARHAEDMADVIAKAIDMLENFYDEQAEKEAQQ
jgi:hypothetical protein